MKETFIQNEIWTLTFGAAFQRANIYEDSATDLEKRHFKTKLRGDVENMVSSYYHKPVDDSQHLQNIYEISNYSQHFASILQGGKLNFGVSQKILNLYLKYQWCLGNIPEPPHFPVDRRIQETLGLYPIISWTQMDNEKDYMKVINRVRASIDDKGSIAAYELKHFERRNRTI